MLREPGGMQQPRRSTSMRYLVTIAAFLTLAGAVSQREGPETVDKVVKEGLPKKASVDHDLDLESGEIPERDYPSSLHDFYKGTWVSTNTTGVPKFKQSSGHVVFQIVTRAHGREIKHVRKPGQPAGKHAAKNGTAADEEEGGRVVLGDGIVGAPPPQPQVPT